MQTIELKYDIISWITGLNDKKLIGQIHKWMEEQKTVEISAKKVSRPKNRNLTKGFGIWANDAPFNENNYRFCSLSQHGIIDLQ